jgi:hypothetical protein
MNTETAIAQDETKPTAPDLSKVFPLISLPMAKSRRRIGRLSLKKVPEGREHPDPVANNLRDCEHGHS